MQKCFPTSIGSDEYLKFGIAFHRCDVLSMTINVSFELESVSG